jgi:hypothetical protein
MGKHDTKRDSDTDIRKYMPDLATILKHADPAHSDRIYREAMDNPELDAAVAERDRQLAAMDGRSSAPSGTDGSPAAGDAPARVSAPSPWATSAEHVVDKAALPSADLPKTEPPPVTSPIPRRVARNRRRALPRWVLPAMGAVVLSPLVMWMVMSKVPPRHPVPVPAASPSQVQAPAPSSSETPTMPSAAPSASTGPTAAPSAQSSAPAATSAPPPVPTAVPQKHAPRGALDDPHKSPAPPAPPPTVEPAPPPPASAAPAAPTSTTPFEGPPVF